MPLPRDLSAAGRPALEAIAGEGPHADGDRVPTLDDLARLLFFAAGITKKSKHPGGEILFRAAACTGALYHIELYLVCGDLPGLEAGVYHVGIHDFGLRRLRQGDHRGSLVRATAGEPAVATSPAVLVLTSTYWRNAWKYQNRAYRHAFWDSGTILANLLAVAHSSRVPARLVLGFIDDPVNRLLDLDTDREAAVALAPLGRGGPAPASAMDTPPLDLPTLPLSRTEVDYPAIREMHAASSLHTEEEVAGWRGEAPVRSHPPVTGVATPLEAGGQIGEGDSVEQVVLHRGSSRRFAREPITAAQLANALHGSTRGIDADFLQPRGSDLNDLYLLVHAVEGLTPGAYVYHRGPPDAGALELLMEGDFRDTGGYLGLGQELPADAAVDVFFLVDLARVFDRYGNRGYRAAQIEAGIIGGKLYLASYAQGFGATGLTFYDDEVTNFFSPHAEGKSVMFLVALGHSYKRRSG
ncbi:MAG: SagB/ThcOx family dehydrogenase [Chloroflexi bacterium]|nr:SagB/ThcOx family dehydrogenase [Chloroflexota bacterium]